MGNLKAFPKPAGPTEPDDPLPPAASAYQILREKRIRVRSVRLPDTLERMTEDQAQALGTTFNNHVVHCLTAHVTGQEIPGVTSCDVIDEFERFWPLLKDGVRNGMTAAQRIYAFEKLHKVGMVLAGKRRAA